MVQTRRAARQPAATSETSQSPPDATPSPSKGARATRRSLKRARNEDEDERPPDDRAPSAAATRPKAPKRTASNDTDAAPAVPKRGRPRGRRGTEPGSPDGAPRVVSAWKVGAHVSAAGGVENAVVNAARVRANAFALFVKSQRKWSSPPLTDASAASFKARMHEFGYDPKHVLPHGSYLINLANPDEAKREKSYECFLDDLRRCEQLGLVFYNFHPGSTVGNGTKDDSISLIAQCLNRAHRETSSVVTVIENMSGAKNIIGSQFTELRGIIDQVEDKSRVGVCLDTCHLYAAGYDISTKVGWDDTLATFDEQVGLSYLRGMHLNDSKTPLGSKKDRHENIGLGTLKMPAFLTIMSDPRVQDIPLILETPTFEAEEIWEREIEALNTLSEVGARPGSSTEQGDAGREEVLTGIATGIQSVVRACRDQVGEKGASGRSTASKSKAGSGRRKARDDEEEEDDETNSDGVR